MSLSHRLNVVRVVTKRELRSTLYGLGIHAAATLILLASSYLILRNVLRFVDGLSVISLSNPITPPFLFSVLFSSVYLGLCAAISIARERDLGTLEVLFYGPVDTTSFVLGKFVQQMLAFVVMLIFATISFYFVAVATNLGFPPNFPANLLLALVLGAFIISIGIALSALNRRMVVAIIIYLIVVGSLYGFYQAYSSVLSMSGPELQQNQALVYARILLERLNGVVRWISPLSYFDRGSLAAAVGDTRQYWWNVAGSVAYTVGFLALAIVAFDRKGVRR